MRIRITDIDYMSLRDGDYLPLSYWGVVVGDEFNVTHAYPDMFIIKCDAEYVVVYQSECEVLED